MWIQVAVDTVLGQAFMNTATQQWDSFDGSSAWTFPEKSCGFCAVEIIGLWAR